MFHMLQSHYIRIEINIHHIIHKIFSRYNRTILELKCTKEFEEFLASLGYNRTILELKF